MHRYAGRIKQERLRNGFTQEQLAAEIGVNVGTVSRWEAGRNMPTPFYVARLTSLFKVSPQDLGLDDDTASEVRSEQPQTREAPVPSIDPVIPQVPVLIGRDREQAMLKHRLSARPSAEVTVLYGLPGVGKTALMASLALDEEVLARYSDGVLWASLGPDPDYTAILARWGTLLEIAPPRRQSQDTWLHLLRREIRHRRVLILLDDVRHRQDAQFLTLAGPRGAQVVATRLPTLAALLSTSAIPVQELDDEQSWALLHHLAPTVTERHAHSMKHLLDAAGGLPLVLTLIGRYVQQQAQSGHPRRLIAALDYLKNAHNRLTLPLEPEQGGWSLSRVHADHTNCVPPTDTPSSTPLSVASLIAETAHHLTPREQMVLSALSMFPAKPESFSEEAALQVGACDVETLDALMDSGLLQTQGQRYQLHPVVRDYASLCPAHAAPVQETAITRFLAYTIGFLERNEQAYASIEQEMKVLQTALDLAWKSQRHQEAFRLTETVTACWIVQRRWEQAERYFSTALQAARQEHEHPHHAIHCLLGLGRCLLARHQLIRALPYYQEAVLYARERTTNEEMLMLTLLKLGAVYLHMAQQELQESYYQQARACCEEAMEVLQRLPPLSHLSPELQTALPLLYEMLGTIALEDEGIQVALDAYRQGLAVSEQLQITDAQCWLLIQRGAALIYRAEFAASEQSLRRALALAKQERLGSLYSIGLSRLLDIMVLTRRREDAHHVLTQFMEGIVQEIPQARIPHERLTIEHSPQHISAWTALYTGRLALVQQDLPTAQRSYEKALHLAQLLPENHDLLRNIRHDQVLLALEKKDALEAIASLGELQRLVPSSEDVLWQGHIYYRRAQAMHLLNLPEKEREDAQRSQAIFRKREHLLGLHKIHAWLRHTSGETYDILAH